MTSQLHNADAPVSFFKAPGEMPKRVLAFNWSSTSLGPIGRWPRSLRDAVGVMLHAPHASCVLWGPAHVQLYNDAFIAALGHGKHPSALGQSARESWKEVWPLFGPQLDEVLLLGKAISSEDQRVLLSRNGRLEESFWSYSFSPIYEDDAVAGIAVVSFETTARVLLSRRLEAVQHVAQRTVGLSTSADVVRAALKALTASSDDVPFALVYSFDRASGQASLVDSTPLAPETRAKLDGRFQHVTLDALRTLQEQPPLPISGVAPELEAVPTASVIPLKGSSSGLVNGFMVFGVSARSPFNHAYRLFLGQLADQLGLTLSRVEAASIRTSTESERDNLMMQAPVAVGLLWGPKLIFRLANPLFRQIIGVKREVIGKPYLQAVPEVAGTPIQTMLQGVFETGVGVMYKDWKVPLDRNGIGALEDHYFNYAVEPMRDLNGAVCGLMIVAAEVTEQVEARQALERAQKERDKLLIDLEAASRTKDEFLAMLGHELRNPLAPIATAVGLMKRDDAQVFAKERLIIERHLNHVVRLVDDLLDVSKITRGKIELRKEHIDVAEVMTKAAEMASVLLEQRNHHLEVSVQPGLRWLADPVRLAQVVSNLLTNAARYTPMGGQITLKVDEHRGQLRIVVRDNGIGITPDVLPRVFELFYQRKRGADRAEGGLGLGLALVRNLVELHGGTVVARSEGHDQGSEFVIELPNPAVAVEESRAPDAKRGAATDGSRLKVLVVDDNQDSAELLGAFLSGEGYDVKVAFDPVAALNVAEAFSPDVAVLDISLPVMDGYELATKLRDVVPQAQLRLIAMSGFGQERDRVRSKQEGFSAHLVKPIDINTLMSALSA